MTCSAFYVDERLDRVIEGAARCDCGGITAIS